MARSYDFVEKLGKDVSIKIFLCLDFTSDLTHCCGVSKSWRRFVIENSLCKRLCVKLCPEVSNFVDIVEVVDKPERVCRSDALKIDESLEREHRVFSFLGLFISTFEVSDEIQEVICASSYGITPEEFEYYSSEDDYDYSALDDAYPTAWCSKGNTDPSIPETVVYKTEWSLCIIQEIHLQAFQAETEPKLPVYSAKAVRFSFGCRKPFRHDEACFSRYYDDDMFVWNYTSPVYPMTQENEVQEFVLPRPVLCMGGIVKMEFLGRVQKNYYDNLYYISVAEAAVIGQYIDVNYDIDVVDDSGSCVLTCDWNVWYETHEERNRRRIGTSHLFTS